MKMTRYIEHGVYPVNGGIQATTRCLSIGISSVFGLIYQSVGVGDSSPTNGSVVQRLARPSGIRETRGSIPGLAFSFLLPHKGHAGRPPGALPFV